MGLVSACAASAAVLAWTLKAQLDAGLVVDGRRLALNVADAGRPVLAILDAGRLVLTGDVGGVVSSFVTKQVVDKGINLCILPLLCQAIEYMC